MWKNKIAWPHESNMLKIILVSNNQDFQFSLVSCLGRIEPDNSISGKIYIFFIGIFLIVYVTDKDEYLDIGVIDTMILKDSRFSPDKYWLFGLSVNNSSKSTISSKLTISDSCETSLKSQKFTWPLASVYISFDKLKTDF